jgi:hypothetical protein
MPTRPGLHIGCQLPFHITGCPDWVPEGKTFEEADAERAQRREARRKEREAMWAAAGPVTAALVQQRPS